MFWLAVPGTTYNRQYLYPAASHSLRSSNPLTSITTLFSLGTSRKNPFSLSIERPINSLWATAKTTAPISLIFSIDSKSKPYPCLASSVCRHLIRKLSDNLSRQWVLGCLKRAFKNRKPEIINSDQGAQFTNKDYVELLQSETIKISMDGKGRALDNIFVERFFRTLKYEDIF